MSWEDIIKDTSFKSLEQMITLWTYDRDAFRMIESRHGRGIFANDFQEWLRDTAEQRKRENRPRDRR